MRRLLTEPLVHFLLLGAALFAVFAVLSGDDRPAADDIVVSAGKIEHLAALFERTWQRPPSRTELEGLVDEHVREEVAYREGLALGIDRDDTIVRRRIRQKLDFMAADLVAQRDPTDAELGAYLDAHADDFRLEPRLSFRHVYLDPAARGAALEADAAELLVALEGDPGLDAAALGDRILLEPAYADVAPREIAGVFGPAFAAAVLDLEPGAWHGPVPSGYGAHLVRIDARTEGRMPALDEVRASVLRDWADVQRRAAIEGFYEQMLSRYEIAVDWPADTGGGAP
jgi:hypothetical protein